MVGVSSLGTRYVSLITRDGTEYLIPNEKLLSERVVNWSYSNAEVRLKLPVGISYKADLRQAIGLCQAAATETPRVLGAPKPVCVVKGFGDSMVDLELRIWINDPKNGVSNVKSDVFLRIWDKFCAQGIELPFPQHDLHLRTPSEIRIVTRNAGDEPPTQRGGEGPRLELVTP
jgi:small-conductance mechanosensitive channel